MIDPSDPIDPDELLGLINRAVGSDADCADLIGSPNDGAGLPEAAIGADLLNEWAAGSPIPRQRTESS